MDIIGQIIPPELVNIISTFCGKFEKIPFHAEPVQDVKYETAIVIPSQALLNGRRIGTWFDGDASLNPFIPYCMKAIAEIGRSAISAGYSDGPVPAWLSYDGAKFPEFSVTPSRRVHYTRFRCGKRVHDDFIRVIVAESDTEVRAWVYQYSNLLHHEVIKTKAHVVESYLSEEGITLMFDDWSFYVC